MTYNIVIPPSIQDKIREQALYIAKDKPSAALSCYDNIYDCIYSLADFPNRCPLAPNRFFVFGCLFGINVGCSVLLDAFKKCAFFEMVDGLWREVLKSQG